jgi:rod shape-determining protein MreD
VKIAGVLAALAAAITLQMSIAGLSLARGAAVDLVLVAVIYVALVFGPATGVLAGTVGGLVQDTLARGIIGIGGLSKTLVGFLVGVLGAQFIVSQPIPRFVMFVGATVVHEVVFKGLYALADARGMHLQFTALLTQAAINGLIGIVVFQVAELGPGLLQRRRARGESLSTRRFS